MQITPNLATALIALHVLSWLYNALVAWMERKGYMEGFTSISVVVGVAYTVAAVGPWIGWDNVQRLAIAFGVSGIPMIAGSIGRHVIARRNEETRMLDHARKVNGD